MGLAIDTLQIDCEVEVDRICNFIHQQVASMRRKGAIIGLSGGVDSALSAELCVRAIGKDRVLGLILPERESNPISRDLAAKQADKLGLFHETIDITPALEGFGAYEKRDQ